MTFTTIYCVRNPRRRGDVRLKQRIGGIMQKGRRNELKKK